MSDVWASEIATAWQRVGNAVEGYERSRGYYYADEMAQRLVERFEALALLMKRAADDSTAQQSVTK